MHSLTYPVRLLGASTRSELKTSTQLVPRASTSTRRHTPRTVVTAAAISVATSLLCSLLLAKFGQVLVQQGFGG